MKNKRQAGFSLLELLTAMMILAILATLSVKKYHDFSARARYIKAQDTVKTVSEGLDQYYLKHGKFPDISSFDAMVDANSPLVKENLIPVGLPKVDPWEAPYEGKSSQATYELKCAGDPSGAEDRKPFSVEPGKVTSTQGSPAAPEKEPAK